MCQDFIFQVMCHVAEMSFVGKAERLGELCSIAREQFRDLPLLGTGSR